MISFASITKRFGPVVALDRVSLEIQAGEIVGIVGPNGAGKTTALRILAGILLPTGGWAGICGEDVVRRPVEAKRHLGYVPDDPYLYEKLTGREFLQFVGDMHRVAPARLITRVGRMIQLLALDEVVDQLIESYSRGFRKRLAIAAALLHEPRVVLLDEPTVGLDPPRIETLHDLLQSLAKDESCVLLSTHSMEFARETCSRLAVIHHGRIMAEGDADSVKEALSDGPPELASFLAGTG